MYKNKRILVVVPARGGSKGIPLKNLCKIQGMPLVALVGKVVSAIPYIDRAVVSTDHDEIALVAEKSGLAAPFRRAYELTGDRIGDFEVLQEALLKCEKIDKTKYDIVVMLQPTSPFRSPKDVTATIDMLLNGNWDSVWTVSETDSKAHPLKQFKIHQEHLEYYDQNGEKIIARQQLEPVYHRNGVAYAMTRSCLLEQKTIKGKKAAALQLKGNYVNIDTLWDIQLAEFILSQKKNNKPWLN